MSEPKTFLPGKCKVCGLGHRVACHWGEDIPEAGLSAHEFEGAEQVTTAKEYANLWETAKAAKRAYEQSATYEPTPRGSRLVSEDREALKRFYALKQELWDAGLHDLASAAINSDPVFGPWKDNNDGHVHNWQTYVSEAVREIWDRLGEDGKFAVYLSAKKAADDEQWD